MKINIISTNNGVGLQQDYLILKSVLEKKHEVNFIDFRKPIHKKADVSIHLEHAVVSLLPTAPKNILIPNPEWFEGQWLKHIGRFNEIWCKTHETERIFKQHSPNCIYTSFTSVDHFNPEIKKDKVFFHNRGKSSHKGTLATIRAWRETFGRLILNSDGTAKLQQKNGMILNNIRMSDEDICIVMNSCLFHLCCSEAEGFGHYINEAKSCGAIILSTDAAPMNEMVSNEFGKLIPVVSKGRHMLGITNQIDHTSLTYAMQELLELSEKELSLMSEKSRQSFLDNDKYFKEKINELL
jgi:hypothetical protein